MPPPNLLQQAGALHSQGKRAEAQKLYQQVLASRPNDPQALHLLGVALFQQGRAPEAVELCPLTPDTCSPIGSPASAAAR